MGHTKILNRVYTLNSSLDFYLLFEHFTTYNYKISYTSSSQYIFHSCIIVWCLKISANGIYLLPLKSWQWLICLFVWRNIFMNDKGYGYLSTHMLLADSVTPSSPRRGMKTGVGWGPGRTRGLSLMYTGGGGVTMNDLISWPRGGLLAL